MIGFLVILFLAGAGLTAYGIWEQKHVYSDQNFAAAKVVGYVPYHGGGRYGRAAGRIANMQHPVVSVTLDSGELRQLKIHTPIAYGAEKNFPELRIGGEISVTYFGQNPKEAFLTDHPLEEKPVKTSTFLMLGIALIATVLVVGVSSWLLFR